MYQRGQLHPHRPLQAVDQADNELIYAEDETDEFAALKATYRLLCTGHAYLNGHRKRLITITLLVHRPG